MVRMRHAYRYGAAASGVSVLPAVVPFPALPKTGKPRRGGAFDVRGAILPRPGDAPDDYFAAPFFIASRRGMPLQLA